MDHSEWLAEGIMVTGLAFVASAVLIPALRVPATRIGWTDNPCHRKRHVGSIPLTGGAAMFLAVMLALLVKGSNLVDYSTLMAGMSLLLLLGILDDLHDLKATLRLAVQFGVATIAVVWGNLELTQLGQLFGPDYGPVGLGPFSTLFSILCMVFLINVLNMADGVDGLAGGIGLLFFVFLALIAWLNNAPGSLITVSLVMAASTAGFLIWNMRFPFRDRARVFMGDAGSMMLGFAAAWLAMAVATHSAGSGSVYPISIAWLLLIPSIDTVALTLRRISLGRSPMSPDRTHLHHILERSGLSITATVGLIHLGVLATGLGGILAWKLGVPEWILFVVAASAFLGYTMALINASKILRWQLRLRRNRV